MKIVSVVHITFSFSGVTKAFKPVHHQNWFLKTFTCSLFKYIGKNQPKIQFNADGLCTLEISGRDILIGSKMTNQTPFFCPSFALKISKIFTFAIKSWIMICCNQHFLEKAKGQLIWLCLINCACSLWWSQ